MLRFADTGLRKNMINDADPLPAIPPAPAGEVTEPDAPAGEVTEPADASEAEVMAVDSDAASPVGVERVPVVAIGTSAGGLEALERFLRQASPASGMAFVVIQHLDPMHKAMLAELLQRTTAMPVAEITDGTQVEANHVYVIPPDRELSILGNTLYLFEPVAPRGLRLAIDAFFTALAADRGPAAIGVILSGMGSDGTAGMLAIRAAGGMTVVQTPESAAYDSMPCSAIAAGLADIIVRPEEMPARIAALRSRLTLSAESVGLADESRGGAVDKALLLLRGRSGHDFGLYKRSTINRRIERRMAIHQFARVSDYLSYLRENPQELDLLFKELLIGVTSFFRDPPAWDYLQNEVIPGWFSAHPGGCHLRAWVAGCSTGEEAYSLAILFSEAQAALPPGGRFTLQIFATDLDLDGIARARAGLFPASIASDVSPERLRRFFVEEGESFRVTRTIREMVTFAPQDLIADPPFTRLDLLSCRNLLIYMSGELQRRLLPLFHYSLNPGGILFLGSAESALGHPELFTALDARSRIYRRLSAPFHKAPADFPGRALRAADARDASAVAAEPSLQSLADRLILQKFAPAALLVTVDGDIVYVSGRTGRYLEPASGKANWNLHAMAREGLRHELANALLVALREQSEVRVCGLSIESDGGAGDRRMVDLAVHPLSEPAALAGLALIVFSERTPPATTRAPARRRGRAGDAERALQAAQEHAQAMREQMQTAQEELKAANEELQSMNEDLQSTNEELTTSKEELQSMNEELQTVNTELQIRVNQLSRANDDMKNLLNSTDLATVFLDGRLRLRRFTTPATKLFRLIDADHGRQLSDIVCDLDYPDLAADARQVLQTLVFSEKEVVTRDGRCWFKVRIMPYRTIANVIDGVVLTFTEITLAKQLEARLRALSGAGDGASTDARRT
jgi:two-component system CheB/CheR fusion protein